MSHDRITLDPHSMAVRTNWGGWVVVPTFNVDVAVGAMRDGIIEPWTTRLVQELLKPGDVYLNAGANFGYYVVLGGQCVGTEGKVYAVEPNPHILPYLLRSVYWGGVPNQVRVFNCALSEVANQQLEFLFEPQFLGGGNAPTLWPGRPVNAKGGTLDGSIWNAQAMGRMTNTSREIEILSNQFVEFAAVTRTIDEICADAKAVDLIHLDIEGAEPHALAGAKATMARSPKLRMITEWSAGHMTQGSEKARALFKDFWDFATIQQFGVRRVEPRLEDDGGLIISSKLSFAEMTETAPHGDYVWVRQSYDPWG